MTAPALARAPADPFAVRLPYSPHRPEVPQHAYLLLDELEVLEALYGGAAGGGKTDALLMAALRFVEVPGYSALLIRRTYAELEQADGLLTRAHEWLGGTDAVFRGSPIPRYTFPSGATLDFGYLDTANSHLRYQGGAYQFVGFDELTQFRQRQYRYLLSRLRRPSGIGGDHPLSRVPLRLRAASNPGGPGHEWVKRRFVEWEPDPDDPDDEELGVEAFGRRIFIPAKLEDNPHLDRAAYRRSLAGLPREEREQLLEGRWDVDTGDRIYDRIGIAAALELGGELDRQAAAGELGPPADAVAFGIDFGEWTHGLIGYPLERGGMYVVAGEELEASELATTTAAILGLADELPRWRGRRQARDLVTLVTDARYDPGSAGAQSIRTFRRIARARHPRLRTTAIPFGNYKRETIDYLRWLIERTADVIAGELDPDTGEPYTGPVLAVSPRAATLRRQLPAYRKNPDTGEPVKDDDHGPDALVALMAPIARAHRDRLEADRARARARQAKASPAPPSRRQRP